MTYSTTNSTAMRSSEGGFTLVELSIVLVIIGLIVGGVLVGQDLIRAAETRAIISQIEKYNTAVNTFKLKYGVLAGDAPIPGDTASLVKTGDNNGLLAPTPGMPAKAPTSIQSEIVWFWQQLAKAGFIDGNYSGLSTATILSASATGGQVPNFPSTKSNRGGIIAYGMNDGNNYYQIGLDNASGTTIKTANNLRPEEAFNIDKKMDDANPTSGAVQARGGTTLESAASEKAGTGQTSTGCQVAKSGVYNLEAVAPSCQLRIRFN